MEIVRDAFTVGQDRELAGVFTVRGEGERKSGLAGEVTHHLEIAGIERCWSLLRATAITPITVRS